MFHSESDRQHYLPVILTTPKEPGLEDLCDIFSQGTPLDFLSSKYACHLNNLPQSPSWPKGGIEGLILEFLALKTGNALIRRQSTLPAETGILLPRGDVD